jgi:hypothetical protein
MTTDELMALANDYASAHAAWVIAADGEEDAKEAEADKIHATLRSALEQVVADSERLDWIGRQSLTDICMSLVVDGPRDGQYFVGGDTGRGYGKTFREAIDQARKATNANT